MLIKENIYQKGQEKLIKDFYSQKIKKKSYKIKKIRLISIFKNKIKNNKNLIKK